MEAMEDPERPMLPTDILGFLSKMRHITGIAKVDAAVDFAEEFLLETERKLVIFLHHKMAAAILEKKLGERMKEGAFNPPLSLHSQLDLNQRMAVIEEFRKPENRIMLASTLASGEGLNLQFCSDCLIMERQWNPSYEEQAEARFPRPGSTADRVNATYLIAAGTIDDFLTDIVETKRRNVAQTLDGKEIEWDEKSLVGELAKVLQTKGLAKWRLSR
jgi:SNF2 family DNA or RNA helicase